MLVTMATQILDSSATKQVYPSLVDFFFFFLLFLDLNVSITTELTAVNLTIKTGQRV